MATGKCQLGVGLGSLDVEAGEDGAPRQRAWARQLGVFTGEQPCRATAAGRRERALDHPQQCRPGRVPVRVDLDWQLVDVGEVGLSRYCPTSY